MLRLTHIGTDWPKNGTMPGLFKNSFSTFWLSELKSPGFALFGDTLPQFGVTPNIPVVKLG